MSDISELIGKTLNKIEGIDYQYTDEIIFHCDDGSKYKMDHSQDCCERVNVEEVIGDYNDLIGAPIIEAECVTYDNEPDPDGKVGPDEDYRWTFYKFRTIKGDVTIRWLGGGSGYYSIEVDFYRMETI